MQLWPHRRRLLRAEVKPIALKAAKIKSVNTFYFRSRTSCTDLPRGACVTVEISIEHPGATLLLNGVRGVVLASRYLIEPCGNGRSKIMHLARVDTK